MPERIIVTPSKFFKKVILSYLPFLFTIIVFSLAELLTVSHSTISIFEYIFELLLLIIFQIYSLRKIFKDITISNENIPKLKKYIRIVNILILFIMYTWELWLYMYFVFQPGMTVSLLMITKAIFLIMSFYIWDYFLNKFIVKGVMDVEIENDQKADIYIFINIFAIILLSTNIIFSIILNFYSESLFMSILLTVLMDVINCMPLIIAMKNKLKFITYFSLGLQLMIMLDFINIIKIDRTPLASINPAFGLSYELAFPFILLIILTLINFVFIIESIAKSVKIKSSGINKSR